MNKEIEFILVRWCKEMVNKYNWLTIKYEFSSSYGVYLVSFSPISEITESEEFNVEVCSAMKRETLNSRIML